jgi:hypothetical protein
VQRRVVLQEHQTCADEQNAGPVDHQQVRPAGERTRRNCSWKARYRTARRTRSGREIRSAGSGMRRPRRWLRLRFQKPTAAMPQAKNVSA